MAAQEILLFVFIRSSMDVGVIITQAWPVVLLVAGLILTGQIFLLIWDSRRSKATDKAIRDVAAAFQYAGIPTYRQSLPDLKKEIDRLRRYGRPLTVAVLRVQPASSNGHNGDLQSLPSDDTVPDKNHAQVNKTNGNGQHGTNGNGNGNGNGHGNAHDQSEDLLHIATIIYGPIVRDFLRDCDIVTYDTINNQFVILLPETSASQASQTMRRLNQLFVKRAGTQLISGISEFPKDGYTIEDLASNAIKDCYAPQMEIVRGSERSVLDVISAERRSERR
jgi:GGDEF domain-containing protein